MAEKFCEHGYENGEGCPQGCSKKTKPKLKLEEVQQLGVRTFHTLTGPRALITPTRPVGPDSSEPFNADQQAK